MNVGATLAVTLLLMRACQGDASDGDGPEVPTDAALPPGADMSLGLPDAGLGANGDMGPGSLRGGLYADPARAADDFGEATPEPGVAGDIGSCFDGEDSDGDGRVDCDDSDCASTVRSCCAGRGDCCSAPTVVTYFSDPASLESCASDPASCLPATGFGAPGPYVADGLSGGGDGIYDSGLRFDERVDLDAERATLRGTFALPVDCAGGCMESVSFGFSDQGTLDDQSHVEPVLALTLSPSRGEVSLRAGDRTLARFAAVAGAWALVSAPDGTIGVETPTGSEAVGPRFVPAEGAHPVIWGHNANPSATASGGARLRALALERSLCDMPRAWAEATVVTDGREALPIGSRPTVANADGLDLLAWESDGAIRLATRASADEPWALAAGPVAPELGIYSDPELLPLAPLGGAGVGLFMVRAGADPGIVRATGSEGEGFGPPALVMEPALVGAEALSGPTLAVRNGAPALVMVAWATFTDRRELHAFASADAGESWAPRGALALPPLDDAEELGAPTLTVQNGAYLLYLPIRRGTRWRIAQLVSDDFVHWRLVDDRVLSSGQNAPLGARAPEARVLDGGVELFYLGVDGVAPTPLRTWRPATDDAILPAP